MTGAQSRVAAGIPTGGQFSTSTRAESGVILAALDAAGPAEALAETSGAAEPIDPNAPRRLRSLAQVRLDEAFLSDMEDAEREARVLELEKGDWVREFGDDEYGIVKSVGARTLTTDTWRDGDTDDGDHVVAVVRKDAAAAILEAHGVIPTRVANAYAKRRQAALDLADRWDAATSSSERSAMQYDLVKTARNVWRSAVDAGLATEPKYDMLPSQYSLPEIQNMEEDYYAYNSMLRFGHSDSLGHRLVASTRAMIETIDRYFGPR